MSYNKAACNWIQEKSEKMNSERSRPGESTLLRKFVCMWSLTDSTVALFVDIQLKK